ncbi:ATP synthase subunit I [Butyrivibrio sp. INlla21]|uniref:ATP synthase subunit I n=1 Tax=Butyrivibrio sp. INlla21 TaxID=1520811 RepID=UPI0008E5B406|nr:ATP synthase subunit I [Butyrivibrio sp. INlla21]SFU75945.1 hypothetical protein SAMN02910342_01633 [Butyrivibrio sp. INlla21]
MKLQSAVKKETGIVAAWTAVGILIMIVVFFVLHMVIPDWAPFDIKVILGAIGGFAVAVGNFFWMAVTVQKVASITDDAKARSTMGVSYRYRTLLQFLWIILAIVIPVINPVSGILPLFIPSLMIKLRGLLSAGKGG